MSESTDWFEQIWEYREVTLYPTLFGPSPEGIFPVPYDILEKSGVYDPRWATCGVFRFAPTPTRPTWTYVSSGLSNEWFKEKPESDGVSGFGCEFLIELRQKADWPIQRLHHIMAFQIGLCFGRFGNLEPLTAGARVSMGGSVDFEEGPLNHLIMFGPRSFPKEIRQDSGIAELIQVYPISQGESDFAKRHGNDSLMEWLNENTEFPVAETNRKLMNDQNSMNSRPSSYDSFSNQI